jgi:hypothetical protein
MPRPPGYNVPGMPRHVVQRGNNRQARFLAVRDYRFYTDRLRAADKHGWDVEACVVKSWVRSNGQWQKERHFRPHRAVAPMVAKEHCGKRMSRLGRRPTASRLRP